MTKIDVTQKAEINAVMGSPGTGKSASVKKRIDAEKPKRLLIYDPESEYERYGTVVGTLANVLDLLKRSGSGNVHIVFVPSHDQDTAKKQFDTFCELAFAAGNLTLVCDELAGVTSPTKAPPGWAKCTLRGRKRGIRIYGASQRPASIDKNFFSSATTIRTGRLNFADDRKTLANVLDVKPEEILNLAELEYIERNMRTGQTCRGKLTFSGSDAKKIPAKPKK
jgi:hypothetical protein